MNEPPILARFQIIMRHLNATPTPTPFAASTTPSFSFKKRRQIELHLYVWFGFFVRQLFSIWLAGFLNAL